MHRTSTALRLGAGAVTVGLLVMVAVSSAGSRIGQGEDRLRVPSLQLPLSLAAMALVLFGAVLMVFMVLQRHGAVESRQRSMRRQLVALVAAMVALVLLGNVVPRRQVEETSTTVPSPIAGEGTTGTDEGRRVAPTGDTVGVAVVLVAGIVLAIVSARRRLGHGALADGDGGPGGRDRSLAAGVGDLLDDVIAKLRADPDPRRAVIGAYAGVEQALAFHGIERRPSESPLELLERALRHLDAGAASIRRLTDLFHQAMFSVHAIDVAMQGEAVDALLAVRDDLRAAA